MCCFPTVSLGSPLSFSCMLKSVFRNCSCWTGEASFAIYRYLMTNRLKKKKIAWSCSYEHFVVLSAMQGPLAFYKGFIPNFGRLGSWNVIMFLTLEQVWICCNLPSKIENFWFYRALSPTLNMLRQAKKFVRSIESS